MTSVNCQITNLKFTSFISSQKFVDKIVVINTKNYKVCFVLPTCIISRIFDGRATFEHRENFCRLKLGCGTVVVECGKAVLPFKRSI